MSTISHPEMSITIRASNGAELFTVPFGTLHVTFAIRAAGWRGEITEPIIARYVADLINSAGESWKRQLLDLQRRLYAEALDPGQPNAGAAAEARAKEQLNQLLSWSALPDLDKPDAAAAATSAAAPDSAPQN
jgi:hypothetical protein